MYESSRRRFLGMALAGLPALIAGCRSAEVGSSAHAPPVSPDNPNAIRFQASETYLDAVKTVADEYNKTASNPALLLPPLGGRATLQKILASSASDPPPDMWLSSAKTLLYNLANAPGGAKFFNADDFSRLVSLPLQPLVILTRGSVADNGLREVFRKENPLAEMREGRFHFSCADVLNSGSGDSVARYLKWAYIESKPGTKTFKDFLLDIKARGFTARLEDSGPVAAAFANDASLDFLITHNSLADREIRNHPELVKITPNPTLFEEPAYILLQNGYDKHREKSVEFLNYLRYHIALETADEVYPVPNTGDVNNEKRDWERVFNDGKRLGGS